MRYLARYYHVVPLEQCLEPDPEDPYRAVVTFDDAYASIYRYAYPVLRELHLPATVFVPTDFVQTGTPMWWDRLRLAIRKTDQSAVSFTDNGYQRVLPLGTPREKEAALQQLAMTLRTVPEEAREDLLLTLCPPQQLERCATSLRNAPLTQAQMQEMGAHGLTFAAHGKSHASFLTLSSKALRHELCESKVVLERWVGQAVTWLSYPYGDFDSRAFTLLPHVGYHAAVTTIDGLSSGENHFALRRLAVGGHTTFPQFVAAVSGLRDLVARLTHKPHRSSPTI
jgi:peptidoglycan/xylan/chitin deacetylase (PgdA/CDA1 family)